VRALSILALVALSACKPATDGHGKAIIGAVLIDGRGGPPLTDSVVVIEGDRIAAAGRRGDTPIPADVDRINGEGKYLVPAIVDVCNRRDLARPVTVEEARALASGKPSMILLGEVAAPIAEAALEAARASGIPVGAQISTQAQARHLVDSGASVLIGVMRDTEDLDSELMRRMRDLRIVVAPALSSAGGAFDVASRNTRRLFQAGVPIAVASMGGDPLRECELLASAGIPPLDVIAAASRNGTIEPGRSANLILLSANPGEDVRNLRKAVWRSQ
jgi:imidazolonepropionase-like amidohydrolase